jgi:hypothetical protein
VITLLAILLALPFLLTVVLLAALGACFALVAELLDAMGVS